MEKWEKIHCLSFEKKKQTKKHINKKQSKKNSKKKKKKKKTDTLSGAYSMLGKI